MVFLTRCLQAVSQWWGPRNRFYAPPAERSWKKDYYKRMLWWLRNRPRHCYRLTRNPYKRRMTLATQARHIRRATINDLWRDRIAAGCGEHGIQFSPFMEALKQNNIALDKKILSTLAIYEPRSFQSICEFVKTQHTAAVREGRAENPMPGPSGIVSRDMIDEVYKIKLEDPRWAKVTASRAYLPQAYKDFDPHNKKD